ncbi:tetratricopeptide repeat protein [Bacillus cytotoxicus]|uniref:Response regulator aspartate phosphatase I n=1 Tax=Bacillus cytotoxicus TaxID=580165 RepID=A0AAX2CGW2_9BACI|nr:MULTISPECIES: tetratricopeptide repeat protein [Bacillus cereus group]SCL92869.1 Response regulator aspartate phosphatase I [Bacillus cytotoxicus]
MKKDVFLQYYYHFFKFIYAMETGNYNDAKEHHDYADELLKDISDVYEKAEFHYRTALYYYYIDQPILSIRYATKAKDFFSKNVGYEVKTAACENVLGISCIALKQFEAAEEYLLAAINTFKKQSEEDSVLKVKYNLGLLYADQNLSELAIRYLLDAFEDEEHDYKTMFLLAREHLKLGKSEIAKTYIEKGLKASTKEYYYHFSILQNMYSEHSLEKVESVVNEGVSYFKQQSLWGYVQEYAEALAVKLYNEKEEMKSNQYFYMSYEAKKILEEKGALK